MSRSVPFPRRTLPPRRGAALIPVIAVFMVAITLAGAWARGTVARFRDQQLCEERAQAEWLAAAGVRRAAARQSAEVDYAGESWRIPGDELGLARDAEVQIRIEPAAAVAGGTSNAESVLQIIAVASYPADEPRVRATRTVTFPTPANEEPAT
jgi:type II secretory pathway component PulK